MPRNAPPTPAHYLITHPDRQECDAGGSAITTSGEHPWAGKLWVDPPLNSSNEDPFVWSSPWLYSYCKAPQLRRVPRSGGRYVRKGSTLLFVDKESAKRGSMVVDTVFFVDGTYVWESSAPPRQLKKVLGKGYRDAHSRHLRFGYGQSQQHPGRYTYAGAPALTHGGQGSFLPLTADGCRAEVKLASLPKSVAERIRSKLHGRLPPILLTDEELCTILTKVWSQTTHAITRCHLVGKNRLTRGCC